MTFTATAGGPPKYGLACLSARTATDRDPRTATLSRSHVRLVRQVGAAAADQQQRSANDVADELSQTTVDFPLDPFTARVDTADVRPAERGRPETAPPPRS